MPAEVWIKVTQSRKEEAAKMKYIVWRSNVRGANNRDKRLITCSCLCSAVDFCGENAQKYGLWIEPVREV